MDFDLLLKEGETKLKEMLKDETIKTTALGALAGYLIDNKKNRGLAIGAIAGYLLSKKKEEVEYGE